MMNKEKHIELVHDANMILPFIPENVNSIILLGSWENVFGVVDDSIPCGMLTFDKNFLDNMLAFLQRGGNVIYVCDCNTKRYFIDFFDKCGKAFGGLNIPNPKKQMRLINIESLFDDNGKLNWNGIKESNMKFDMIIQNPPYKGSLHLDFFEKGLNLLREKGKMVIVEPATWLINVRRNGKASRYNEIKKKIEGHVESVVIENLNNEFGTEQQVPFATTTIDMGNTFSMIDFKCFGEHRTVSSIYDCNMIGDYNAIQSILTKCQSFGDVMENHATKRIVGNNAVYVKYASDILGRGFCSDGNRALSDATYQIVDNGSYHINYVGCCYHTQKGNGISEQPFEKNDFNGNKKVGEIGGNLYGTREELENWKHFVFSNKLPLFLNIVLTIDQHNNSTNFVPWLVDRQHTDDEINQKFGFTEEEISLMDMTLKKYERNSPWFRRYMLGKDSATDEEVNNFIQKISTQC